MRKIKHIAVLTSGGDAPGMNAAIRAVVRMGLYHDLRVTAIYRGYQGLFSQEYAELQKGSVANIIQRGGTIIKTDRCKDFYSVKGRAKAAQNFRDAGFDALVAIGGDGTFTGAHLLWKEHKIPVVGVPGTIDNDVYGTDRTIGFDTAVNTAMEAIDKVRDTAASHDRLFLVEVMGRNSGHIALEVGLAAGAEEVFIPESHVSIKQVCQIIERGIKRGKKSSILICAEGHTPGRSYDIAKEIKRIGGYEAKVCILGHIQRGGSPTSSDRCLASRMGASAVEFLLKGKTDIMVGEVNLHIVAVPLKQAFTKKKYVRKDWIYLQKTLSI